MKNTKEFAYLANDIVENNKDKQLTKDRLFTALINSYQSGVYDILNKKASKPSKRESVQKFQGSVSDTFIENVGQEFLGFFFDTIKSNAKNRVLNISWQEDSEIDVQNLIKAIYDLGFLNGAEIAQDPEALKIYLKHRDEIANGKSK